MKYKYIKNITKTSADLFIYGAIVDENMDWWTNEPNKMDIDPLQLKEELDKIQNVDELNIYINSPGGSVFASSTICSMLQRFKEKSKATINGYIDGLCASAATFILMVADNVKCYRNSIMMIHKPLTYSFGNANDLKKDIETLENIEYNVMLPLYNSKSKVDNEILLNLIDAETWFNSNELSEKFIGNYFNIQMLEEQKNVAACVSNEIFKNYKNVPKELEEHFTNKQRPKQQEIVENKIQNIDYSYFENKIKKLKN